MALTRIGLNQSINLASNVTGTLPSGNLPAGSILQVASVTKTDVFSTSSTSFTNITDLSITITPSSTSNKIISFFNGSVGNSQDDRNVLIAVARDGTTLGLADASGTRARSFAGIHIANDQTNSSLVGNVAFQYTDSPNTTSSTTYTIQMRNGLSGVTAYLGRGGEMSSSSDQNRTTFSSEFTIMEIAG